MENQYDGNKRWSELDLTEKHRNEDICRATREKSDYIANKYNFLLYNWLVILNAGGLIGVIYLLNYKDACSFKFLSCIGSAFALALILIISAAFLERCRFNLNANRIKNKLDDLRQDKISINYFQNELTPLIHYKCLERIVYIFEILSFLLFISGVIIVIYHILAQGVCSS